MGTGAKEKLKLSFEDELIDIKARMHKLESESRLQKQLEDVENQTKKDAPLFESIRRIVEDLNCELYELWGDYLGCVPTVNVRSNGCDIIVDFLGFPLWDSVDEGLDDDQPQALDEYLRTRINEILDKLGTMKVCS